MNGGAIASLRSPDEERILEGTSVDEELRPAPGGLRIARTLHETRHLKCSGRILDRHESPSQVSAPDRGEPLSSVLVGRNSKTTGPVGVELEACVWVSQGKGGYCLVRRARLTGSRPEELTPGRG